MVIDILFDIMSYSNSGIGNDKETFTNHNDIEMDGNDFTFENATSN